MNSSTQKSTITIAGAEVGRTCHACAFFHSRDEYYEVLLPFIKDGLNSGDKALHVVEHVHHEDHLERLRKENIPVSELMASGQLEVKGWTESFIKAGAFKLDDMAQMLSDTLQQSKKQGFGMSRLVGNMEWANIKGIEGVNDLVKYETLLNKLIENHETIFVCCYDLTKHSATIVMDVLRTHQYVIMGGTMHENPYYVTPNILLEEIAQRESKPTVNE